MNILISNDDGIKAPGLHRLVEVAREFGDVIAVAPDTPQSGKSSAITVDSPLYISEHNDYEGAKMYSVSGTPTDCVKLALHTICPVKPDLMLSGINHGSNAGNSVVYSGTMGAAIEACMSGIPAVGFSLTHHSLKADFKPSIPFIRDIIAKVIAKGLPEGVCLNVNIPAQCNPKGVKIVRAARGHWTDEYANMLSPHGKPFYWLTGRFVNLEEGNDQTDEYWLERQYISIVPVAPQAADTDAVNWLQANYQ